MSATLVSLPKSLFRMQNKPDILIRKLVSKAQRSPLLMKRTPLSRRHEECQRGFGTHFLVAITDAEAVTISNIMNGTLAGVLATSRDQCIDPSTVAQVSYQEFQSQLGWYRSQVRKEHDKVPQLAILRWMWHYRGKGRSHGI